MKVRFDNRYVAPLFITCILLVGHLFYGFLESYERTALAIGAAIVTELVLGRIFFGKWLNLASAYITGISVGILLRSPARERSAPVESFKLRHLRVVAARAGDGCGFECAVGQLHLADAGNLDTRFDHHLAREAVSHQFYLRRVVLCVCVYAQLDYGASVASGSGADHRAYVSTVCVLHGH
jgi:hypothetical protein